MKQALLLMTAALAFTASAEVVETQHLNVIPSKPINSRLMKAPQQATVLKTLKSGAMGELQLVRTADGRIAKQIVRNGNSIKPLSLNRPSFAAAALGSLNEDFGSWDGETHNWIPEGWSEINSDDPTVLENINSYTWHVEKGGGFMPQPTSGNLCGIYYALNLDTYMGVPQDEWLITPAITVEEGQQLQVSLSYTPFFMFNTNLIDWDTYEFTSIECAASVKLMVREAGTEEWTLVEDYFDAWKDYSVLELFDDGLDSGWRKYTYDLEEYAGKDIELAFRYNGCDGENWGIDYVVCDQPRPEAAYLRPQGAFYWGFSNEYSRISGDGKQLIILPGETEITWSNVSNEEATVFEWTYFDPETDEIMTSDDYDLTLTYPMLPESDNWYNIPELAAYASAGATPSTFALNLYCLQAGGTTTYTFSNGNTGVYTASNCDYDNGMTSVSFGQDTPLFGISAGTDAGWTSLLGQNAELTAVGNYFEKPAVPYQLNGISVFAGGSFDADAQISLTVYEVIGGYLADPIAIATCTGADIIATDGTFLCLPFTFDEITVDQALLVMMDVQNATGFTTLTPWHTYYPAAQNETNGYFMVEVNGQEQLHGLNYIQNDNGPLYCSFYFNLNMSYPSAEVPPVALESISQSSQSTERYNVAGQRINGQQNGLVIERMNDGSVRKIVK